MDDLFLHLNGLLNLVPEERVQEARKVQSDEIASGRKPRLLLEILNDEGMIDPELSAKIDSMLRAQAAPPTPDSATPVTSTSNRHIPRPAEVDEAEKDPRNLLAHFILLAKVGQGGMGSVYRAWDNKVGRLVALKFLHSPTPEDLELFAREAHIASKLQHPSIATVFEVGEHQGRHYISMKFIEGVPLGSRPLPIRQSLERVRDAALLLQHAHDQGIIHRDVKPGNLMVDTAGRLYLTDFGLAKDVGNRVRSQLSITGHVVGTVDYMSPEQARGATRQVDARSDIYSLGATLYRLLAGRTPFEGGSVLARLKAVAENRPPPLHTLNRAVSPELEALVEKAMAKDREQRFPTAGALAGELDRILREKRYMGKHGLARLLFRRWLPVAAAAVLLALGLRVLLPRLETLPSPPRPADPEEIYRAASINLGHVEARLGTLPESDRRARLSREVLGRLGAVLDLEPRHLGAQVSRVRAFFIDGRGAEAKEELARLTAEWRRDYRIPFLRALIRFGESFPPAPLPALEAPFPDWHEPPAPFPVELHADLTLVLQAKVESAPPEEHRRDLAAARALLPLLENRYDEAATALADLCKDQALPLYSTAWCRAAYLARRFEEVRASPASAGRRERLGAGISTLDLESLLPECAQDAPAALLVRAALARRALRAGRNPEDHVAAGLALPVGARETQGILLACRLEWQTLAAAPDETLCRETLERLGPSPSSWMGRLAALDARLALADPRALEKIDALPLLEPVVAGADLLSKASPGWSAPRLRRARAHFLLGKPHDALGELAVLLKGPAPDPAAHLIASSVRLALAEERRRSGIPAEAELADALKDAAAALGAFPDHPAALNLAAAATLAMAEEAAADAAASSRLVDDALLKLERAPKSIRTRVHRAQGLYLRGQTRGSREDLQSARAELDDALLSAPRLAEALYVRGIVHFALGDRSRAKEDWTKLAAEHPAWDTPALRDCLRQAEGTP